LMVVVILFLLFVKCLADRDGGRPGNDSYWWCGV
jgi:hypothetical protein